MRLLSISGLLGSGKAAIPVQAAHALVHAGQSVAIVENEVGEIGVDGDVVRELGIPVRDLSGGCVCCSLRSCHVETLHDIAAQVAPDRVIMEPTGLA
ncbi:MAG: GTP-binding protein [Armatimonadota bacterium]